MKNPRYWVKAMAKTGRERISAIQRDQPAMKP